MQNFTFDLQPDGVALIRIDMPDRRMNVITTQFVDELERCIQRLASTSEIRGAVLTSGKKGGFVAGADVKDMLGRADAGISAVDAAAHVRRIASVFRSLETCGKPVAAAMNGLALGGGLELALACHFRVLADHAGAVVGFPEVGLGLLPGAGGTQRLPRLIGIARALPLLLDGRHIAPQAALELGIVDRIAPAAEVVQRAREWLDTHPAPTAHWDRKGYRVPGGAGPLATPARELFVDGTAMALQGSGLHAPARLAILSCVYEGTNVGFDAGMRIESKYFGQLLSAVSSRNLMRTMFINKGLVDKGAHRPRGVPKAAISKVALLGSGEPARVLREAAQAASIAIVDTDEAPDLVVAADACPSAIVLRLFPSVGTARLAEICARADDTPETIAAGFDLATQLGYTPILCRGESFVDRLVRAYRDEGRTMLRQGRSAPLIDNSARQCGFPVGPLDAKDVRPSPAPEASPEAAREAGRRLMSAIAIEALRALADGCIATVVEADLASVLGAGMPAWTGGAVSYVDTVGVADFVAQCRRWSAQGASGFGAMPNVDRWLEGRSRFHPPVLAQPQQA